MSAVRLKLHLRNNAMTLKSLFNQIALVVDRLGTIETRVSTIEARVNGIALISEEIVTNITASKVEAMRADIDAALAQIRELAA
jgi:hypothetical protein